MVGILASTCLVNKVSFETMHTFCIKLVVFDTVYVSHLAEGLIGQGETIHTSDTTSITTIFGTIPDPTSIILHECPRILTLITSLLIHPQTSPDDASTRIKSERLITRNTHIVAVVMTTWCLLYATRQLG